MATETTCASCGAPSVEVGKLQGTPRPSAAAVIVYACGACDQTWDVPAPVR